MNTLNLAPRDEAPAGPRRALLVTSAYTESQFADRMGKEHYSYRIVYRAFAPLLRRWATTVELDGTPEEIDRAAADCRRRGVEPIHLSFLPLHVMHFCPQAANVGVPAWEFPEIPSSDLGGQPRHNWLRRAEQAATLITHTTFSRDAFVRSGVKPPVHVVPVPLAGDYFRVPAWQPGQRVTLDCPCYVFPQEPLPAPSPPPAARPRPLGSLVRSGFRLSRDVSKYVAKRYLPPPLNRYCRRLYRAARAARHAYHDPTPPQHERVYHRESPALELSGVVFTTVSTHRDSRKNLRDLLTGFLMALGDREDATLVVKLVLSPGDLIAGLNEVIAEYRYMLIPHRCKVAFVGALLSDEQMVELARGTTFYLNTSRAEGSCLPVQNFLAAGRPCVAPAHTGLADSVNADNSLVVASHPEPICFPQDPQLRLQTTWHRLVWQSLHDQLRVAYRIARQEPARYEAMAGHAREHMRDLATPPRVWPLLEAALDDAAGAARAQAGDQPIPAPLRRAA